MNKNCQKCHGKGRIIKDILNGSTEPCPLCYPMLELEEVAEEIDSLIMSPPSVPMISPTQAQSLLDDYRARLAQDAFNNRLLDAPDQPKTATEVREKQKAYEDNLHRQQKLIGGVLKNPPKVIKTSNS